MGCTLREVVKRGNEDSLARQVGEALHLGLFEGAWEVVLSDWLCVGLCNILHNISILYNVVNVYSMSL